MNHGIKTIIVPVKDLAAAKALYTALLGVEPYAGTTPPRNPTHANPTN